MYIEWDYGLIRLFLMIYEFCGAVSKKRCLTHVKHLAYRSINSFVYDFFFYNLS